MLNFYSWRWSQLLRRSAAKRVITHIDQIFILILFEIVLLFLFVQDKQQLFHEQFFVLWATAIIIFDAIAVICMSDQYFTIKSGSKIKYRIYLYTAGVYSGKEDIEMIILNDKKEYQIRDRIKDNYRFYRWSDWSSFLFYSKDNAEWFYVTTSDDIIQLGNRVGETVFRNPQKPNKMCVLIGRGSMIIEAETFFFNGVYIPPVASKNIVDAETGEKLDNPQDFLVAKRGKEYTVYGLYKNFVKKDSPQCRILRIPNIIFKAGDQDVILQWQDNILQWNDGYREIYRTQHSVKRQVNDIFVELTYQNGIGGTVKKFNEETGKLDTLYKGYFRGIDFDSGSVIGDNFEYKEI